MAAGGHCNTLPGKQWQLGLLRWQEQYKCELIVLDLFIFVCQMDTKDDCEKVKTVKFCFE